MSARRYHPDWPTPQQAEATRQRRAAEVEAFAEGFSKAGLVVLLLITGCRIMGVGL